MGWAQLVQGISPHTLPCHTVLPVQAHGSPALVGDYLADHPNGDDPDAPLFPNLRLAPKPTGKKSTDAPATAKEKAQRRADALAALTVTEAEDRACARLG